jgi:hypothetical protein
LRNQGLVKAAQEPNEDIIALFKEVNFTQQELDKYLHNGPLRKYIRRKEMEERMNKMGEDSGT